MSGLAVETILRASLCREPHCATGDWKRSAESKIENLTWAAGYAERGYTEGAKGVLLANWNYFPAKVADVLERAGYDVQWSDEWSTCDCCSKLVRTSPDCYDWQPYFILADGELTCLDCVDWEAYLESIEDNPRAAVVRKCDPSQFGYSLVSRDHENGFHPGQNDDPKRILAELEARDMKRIVFRVAETSQFYIRFEVWQKAE
jgi:hypothetical protein